MGGVLATALLWSGSASAVEGFGAWSIAMDLNSMLGAPTFYQCGYTGKDAVVANAEAGWGWSAHDALLHEQQTASPLAIAATVGGHATRTAFAMAGDDPYRFSGGEGLAPHASLWSVAMETQYDIINGDAYGVWDLEAQVDAYRVANDLDVDVINSSWNYSNFDALGHSVYTFAIDEMIVEEGVTFVTSAGNSGPSAESVSSPGSSFNGITVGATTGKWYDEVRQSSSRGPSTGAQPFDVFGDEYETTGGVRAVVHLLAPGTNVVVADYTGLTGDNSENAVDPCPGCTDAYTTKNGTSYSSPMVAGGAALLVDAARDRFSSDPSRPFEEAADPRTIRAVLINSADKLNGWDNGLAVDGNGVFTTEQSLDWAQGGGQMDLDAAWFNYAHAAATRNVPGLVNAASKVRPKGWDFGAVGEDGQADYMLNLPLNAGDPINLTLSWFVHHDFVASDPSGSPNGYYERFTDLNLSLWHTDTDGNFTSKVAQSVSEFNNVEHLSITVPSDGTYGIRVHHAGALYDFLDDGQPEPYALAWAAGGRPTLDPCMQMEAALDTWPWPYPQDDVRDHARKLTKRDGDVTDGGDEDDERSFKPKLRVAEKKGKGGK
jgi:hypothetical protein